MVVHPSMRLATVLLSVAPTLATIVGAPVSAVAGEDAEARTEALRRELRSRDAATVAWAAYAAGREGRSALVPDLLRCFEERPHSIVIGHLLDALIRLDGTVPMKLLTRHQGRGMTSVFILALRNGEEAFPFLRQILPRSIDDQRIRAIGVAAGNVLAAAKDPAMAALFLRRIEPMVSVTVVDHDRPVEGGIAFGPGHGDGVYEAAEGFPPAVWYELDFAKSERLESRLLVEGPTTDVWYSRWENASKRFIIGDLSDHGDVTQIGLGWVASLLGVDREDLPLRSDYYFGRHKWTEMTAYLVFLEEHRRVVRRDGDALLDRLLTAGLLTADDRRDVNIQPRFHVNDQRDRQDEPLPAYADAYTTRFQSPLRVPGSSLPGTRADVERCQELSKEFVLQAPLQEVAKSIDQWHEMGNKAASALKEIALSPKRHDGERWRAVELLTRLDTDDAQGWYLTNLTLRLAWNRGAIEGLEVYPCANALARFGWSALPNLVRSAEDSYLSDEWKRVAARLIFAIARRKARAVIAAFEITDSGLLGHLPEK
jgi:hypothetical protein